jgi:hypothetical protein
MTARMLPAGLPKSSKFCLEGRPRTKLPGLGSAMTTGDMRGKIEVCRQATLDFYGLLASCCLLACTHRCLSFHSLSLISNS